MGDVIEEIEEEEFDISEGIEEELCFILFDNIFLYYNIDSKYWRAEIEDYEIEEDILIIEDEPEGIIFEEAYLDLWGRYKLSKEEFLKIKHIAFNN